MADYTNIWLVQLSLIAANNSHKIYKATLLAFPPPALTNDTALDMMLLFTVLSRRAGP